MRPEFVLVISLAVTMCIFEHFLSMLQGSDATFSKFISNSEGDTYKTRIASARYLLHPLTAS